MKASILKETLDVIQRENSTKSARQKLRKRKIIAEYISPKNFDQNWKLNK